MKAVLLAIALAFGATVVIPDVSYAATKTTQTKVVKKATKKPVKKRTDIKRKFVPSSKKQQQK